MRNIILALAVAAALCGHASGQMYTNLPNVNPRTGLWDGYSGGFNSTTGYGGYYQPVMPYRSESYRSGIYGYRSTYTPYGRTQTWGINTYGNPVPHTPPRTFQYHGVVRNHR